MVKTILIVLIVICCASGLCEFIYFFKMFFICPDVRTKNHSLFVLKKGFAVSQLKFIYYKIRWHGNDFSYGIIGLVDLLDQDEIEACNRYIEGKKIILCYFNEISNNEFIKGVLFNE